MIVSALVSSRNRMSPNLQSLVLFCQFFSFDGYLLGVGMECPALVAAMGIDATHSIQFRAIHQGAHHEERSMAKHQVFLVHGMGNYEKGWSTGIKQLLLEKFAQYPQLAGAHWSANFEFKEIVFSDEFEAWRQQWKDDAAKAAEALTALDLDSGAATNLVKLAQAPTGNSFWQTHVLDVVMYRYLRPLNEAIRRSIQAQLMGHIDSFPANNRPQYSVIAYSLGSSVMYETFHAMLTGPGGLPSGYRPINFFAVSNVIKPLWNRGGTCYPPDMGPNLGDDEGLCFRFCNFSHELDPICNLDPFNPPAPGWFGATAPQKAVYLNVTIPTEDVQDWNVHALEHYLGHPDVHVPILRTLTRFDELISKKEHQGALVEWRKNTLSAAARKKVEEQLKKMRGKATTGFSAEIETLLSFRTAVLKAGKKDGES